MSSDLLYETSVSIVHRGLCSYIWWEPDMRMVMDNFGTLQIVPFCFGPWDYQAFDPT